ncbi:MAG: PA14 domain-containing protein [Desulfobacteraceae bacterium]|jgi:hypothetical protein|nr:PA14 domain-containing protein [Desulfobacteraceae bacterium]
MKNKQGKRDLLFGLGALLPVLVLIVLSLGGCAGSEPMKSPAEGEPQPLITLSENMPTADTSLLQKPPILVTGLSPLNPQPAGTALVPGLAVAYFYNYKARHLNPLTNGNLPNKEGKPGPPIPFLNHQFKQDEVFNSGANRFIAMRMQGMLHFPQSGSYMLLGLSNDGLRIYLDDQLIIDDPEWHARGDQYTVGVVAEIAQAGWYSMKVEYNQRKGTAAIGLFWRRPGSDDFEPVPAEAYAHIPGSGS